MSKTSLIRNSTRKTEDVLLTDRDDILLDRVYSVQCATETFYEFYKVKLKENDCLLSFIDAGHYCYK